MRLFHGTAKIISGNFPIAVREKIRECMIANTGKTVTVTISTPKKYSTNKQRNYYFSEIVEKFQHYFAGQGQYYDIEDLHHMMMADIGNFWLDIPNPFTETIDKKLRSFNEISTTEAMDYFLKCQSEAAQRNFTINDPREQNV